MMKMNKILLIQPPFLSPGFYRKDFFKSKTVQSPILPLGIAYLAAFIEKHGYQVRILDIHAQRLTEDEVITRLRDYDYDIVGISALINQYSYTRWLAKTIKSLKDVPVIVGNGLATSSHMTILEHIPECDLCVRGEGEFTLWELLKKFSHLSTIEGITYRDSSGRIIINPDRKPHRDIDEFPEPAYNLFDVPFYSHAKLMETGIFNTRLRYQQHPTMPLITARGCPFQCTFCSKVIPGVRLRSVRSIVEEIN
ncbi:B12-binding domain-containing radical SAM protein, partial [Candidatus Omnitrophota bacterium]